jgi:hypothetical protein
MYSYAAILGYQKVSDTIMPKKNIDIFLCAGILLPSSVRCLLTDPGSLCPGDMVTLTCNVTGGVIQQWRYNAVDVGDMIIPALNQVPEVPAVPLMVNGVVFQLILLSITPNLASQIAFVASENMDGRMVECRISNQITERTTLQVGSGSKCRLRDMQMCT